MADLKISQLTGATTPLAGTEVLPIVQSGATRQVSVANLTTGRALSATELTLTTGNLVFSNGKGIDFSATPGTGTSELLNDYEEGNWTPTMTASSSGTITLNGSFTGGKYTKIGRQVTVTAYLYVSSVASPAGDLYIEGLPFTSGGDIGNYSAANLWTTGQNAASVTTIFARVARNDTKILLQNYAAGAVAALANKVQNGNEFSISATYFV